MTAAVAEAWSVTLASQRAGGAEQQFVGDQALVTAKNGLTRQEKIVGHGGVVSHENSQIRLDAGTAASRGRPAKEGHSLNIL